MKKGILIFVCISALIVFALWIPKTIAFPLYSTDIYLMWDRGSFCSECHGPFTDSTSAIPNNEWPPYPGSPGKHGGHGNMQVVSDCSMCHQSGSIRAYLKDGCVHCHGTTTIDETTGPESAMGLRAHHALVGITDCYACHSGDPDPFPENVMPLGYYDSNVAITDPCNSDGSENRTTDGLGLDNDGDGLYDLEDPDCGNVLSCYSNDDCSTDTEYCKKAVGDCDGMGTCQPLPDPCMEPVIDEVCGCDGMTYLTECDANYVGENVDYKGVCIPILPPCPDSDGDGYAVCDNTCDPTGFLCSDCNDTDQAINPATAETCDQIDNNCGGLIDEGFDLDYDGFTTCEGDCNDNDATITPSASEECDGVDNNCDNIIDGITRSTVCGVGACEGNTGNETCTDGIWGNDTCDPYAGASPESCDNIDNDCDGAVDENLSRSTTCGVGACAGNTGTETCSAGTWGNDTCNPYAGASDREKGKLCKDGIDNDCNGFTDGADPGCGGDGDTGETEGKGQTCSDGIDNDGDGLEDCADPDCAKNKSCK